jgi:phosphoenolpyruvate carboxykinase (ATP)
LDLLGTTLELEAFVLNTGQVGGEGEGSNKVRIQDSSAIVQGIVEGSILWDTDPDFGYEIARRVPGVDDIELLQPVRLYQRQGRGAEYEAQVQRLKKERRAYLKAFDSLHPEVLAGLEG